MPKLTRKEEIKLLILKGYDDAYIKATLSTSSKFIEECKVEIKNSINLMVIDKKK